MKIVRLLQFCLAFLLGGIVLSASQAEPDPGEGQETSSEPLKNRRADGAFGQMMAVLTHKRCLNCHPSGDRPRQGEDSHLHRFEVQRGEDGHGLAALRCGTCHQKTNNAQSGVPGAPHWHLAPRSMAWEGLSRVEIARSMLDPSRNGGRSPQEIEQHLTEDLLVLWAFDPGVDHEGTPREKPPVSQENYVQAVRDWFAAGTPIPEE